MKTYRTRSPPPRLDDAQRPPKLLVDPPDLQRRELLWRSRRSPQDSVLLLARRRHGRGRGRRDDHNLLRLVLGTTANTDDNTCNQERDMSVELRCRESTWWVVWRGGGGTSARYCDATRRRRRRRREVGEEGEQANVPLTVLPTVFKALLALAFKRAETRDAFEPALESDTRRREKSGIVDAEEEEGEREKTKQHETMVVVRRFVGVSPNAL